MEEERTGDILLEAYEIILQQRTPSSYESVGLVQSPLIVTILILTFCVIDTVCI